MRSNPITVPTNPGAYPTVLDPNQLVLECQIAEHKFAVKEFETYLSVKNTLRLKIHKVVDSEWLGGICYHSMSFTHLTPLQMLDHLKCVGALLDYMDVSELISKLTEPWDSNKVLPLVLHVTIDTSVNLSKRAYQTNKFCI
jgi:hypothetical protein